MRWADERYVKVYTRDTPDWLALGWEAHALFWELLRKSDRAGIFELGKSGSRGISAVTGIPVEVVDRVLPILVEDGCVEQHGAHLLIRNFIEAQDANQSDKARQQKAREKARDEARREMVKPSQNVTVEHEAVTKRDLKTDSVTATASSVTPILAIGATPEEPSLSRAREDRVSEPENPAGPTAHGWLSFFSARYWQAKGRQYGHGEADAKSVARLGEWMASVQGDRRAADWEARERMVAEFFASSDRATVAAGWPFAFFVSAFRGLAIPPEQRPKVSPNGKPAPMQARY